MLKSKLFAVASAIVALAGAAQANNVHNIIDLTGGTISFGALHSDRNAFTDTYDFNTIVGTVLASTSLVTIGFTLEQNIDFIAVTLNDVPLTLSPTGEIETASTPFELNLTGPLQLVVVGITGATSGNFSSYSGTLNVTSLSQVPEPGTGAMLLMGLGLTSLALRHRRLEQRVGASASDSGDTMRGQCLGVLDHGRGN